MSQSGCWSRRKGSVRKEVKETTTNMVGTRGLLKIPTCCSYNPWTGFPLRNHDRKSKAVCAHHSSCFRSPARLPCGPVLLLLFFLPVVSFCCLCLASSFLAAFPGNCWPSTVTSAQRSWATRKSLISQAILPSRSMKMTLLEPTTNLQKGKRKKQILLLGRILLHSRQEKLSEPFTFFKCFRSLNKYSQWNWT